MTVSFSELPVQDLAARPRVVLQVAGGAPKATLGPKADNLGASLCLHAVSIVSWPPRLAFAGQCERCQGLDATRSHAKMLERS